jgi:sugar/nucleoside kinase (ribokinase family)
MKYDLVSIGHIALDYIERRRIVKGPQLGGPCVYAAIAARALAGRAAVISKVGSDFQERHISWLKARGISVANIKIAGPSTTRFRINYQNEKRTLRATSTCEPFDKRDFSNLPSSSAMHIGPVFQEIPVALAQDLAASNSVVALDPQGYVRKLGANGSVRIRKWKDAKLFKMVDVLKVSDEEIPAVLGNTGSVRKLANAGSGIVLLTRGTRGTIVWSKDYGAFEVPTFPTRVRDPTGAGDALLGAFLVTWIRTSDLLWSASVGSAVASFVVERTRPVSFGTRKQIEERTSRILDRVVRI